MLSRAALVIALALVAAPASAAPACYARAQGQRLVIGNARVEVALDRKTGAVVDLFDKISHTHWLARGGSDVFQLGWSGFAQHGIKDADPWSVTDAAPVFTKRQRVSAVDVHEGDDGASLTVRYDALALDRGNLDVRVEMQIELRRDDDETRWQLSIDNRDRRGVVRDVQFPVLAPIGAADALLLPNHGGEILPHPLEQLSDEAPVASIEYPGRASMQWFAVTTPKATLAIASHDRGMAYTRLAFGRRDAGAAMIATKLPFLAPGARWDGPPYAVGLHAGTWHRAADRYRSWLRTWVQPPDVAKRVRDVIGSGAGLYIKDRTEKTLAPYSKLVELARQQPAGSERSVMLIGWFKNGHDTYFPEYDAIPELGGAAALRDAIGQAHALGAHVTAYVNGRLANVETDTYKKFGKRWSVLGRAPGLGVGAVNFFELHERWNTEWARDARGEGWFAVMCPSAKGWQDHLVGQALHVVRDYGFDAIFLDQPGSYYAELCHNPHHGHSSPSTAWGPGQIEIFRRIKTEARKLNPDFVLSTEGMNDVLGEFLDFHTDKNPVWEPMRTHPQAQTFPELWRYTFPEYVTSNGPVAYSFAPARDKIYGPYYRFVLGVHGIGRSFGKNVTGSDDDRARLDAVVTKIERLANKAAAWLLRGRYVDVVGLTTSSAAIFARAHVSREGIAIPVWNTSDRTTKFDVRFDRAAVEGASAGPADVVLLDADRALAHETVGARVSATIELPPHEADVVVIRPAAGP